MRLVLFIVEYVELWSDCAQQIMSQLMLPCGVWNAVCMNRKISSSYQLKPPTQITNGHKFKSCSKVSAIWCHRWLGEKQLWYILIEQKSANIKSQECRQASISQNELKYWLRTEGRFTLSTELGRVFWLPRDRISGECILSLSKSIKLSLLSDCLAHESCCNNLVWNKRHVSFCSPVSDNYFAVQLYQI